MLRLLDTPGMHLLEALTCAKPHVKQDPEEGRSIAVIGSSGSSFVRVYLQEVCTFPRTP